MAKKTNTQMEDLGTPIMLYRYVDMDGDKIPKPEARQGVIFDRTVQGVFNKDGNWFRTGAICQLAEIKTDASNASPWGGNSPWFAKLQDAKSHAIECLKLRAEYSQQQAKKSTDEAKRHLARAKAIK